MTDEKQAVAANTFPCPGCAGQMAFDPEEQCLLCGYCGNRVAIDAPVIEAPEYLYNPATDAVTAPDWEALGTRPVRCRGCGAQNMLGAEELTATCPFCGSHYVVDFDAETQGILPETLMPFHISRSQAAEAFRTWVKKRFWAPGDFKKTVRRADKMKGIYLPYWTYDAQLQTEYSGRGGRDRTVVCTRTVNGKTQTYHKTVTDWYFLSGQENLAFDDRTVCAADLADKELLAGIGAYNTKFLNRYHPAYLAGFAAERYNIGVGEGWNDTAPALQAEMERFIRQQEGYDHYRDMTYHHRFFNVRFKHILLPVWTAYYRFNHKTYVFMMNGETGKATGRAPVSPLKVTAAVLIGAVAVALLALLFYLIGSS